MKSKFFGSLIFGAIVSLVSLTATADHPHDNSVFVDGNQGTSVIMYDCGKGFLQPEACGKNDREISSNSVKIFDCAHDFSAYKKPSVFNQLSGYDKTYRCNNGRKVTHPSYCPDSGTNNITISKVTRYGRNLGLVSGLRKPVKGKNYHSDMNRV